MESSYSKVNARAIVHVLFTEMVSPKSTPHLYPYVWMEGEEKRVKRKREVKVNRIFLILAHSGYLRLTFSTFPSLC